MLSSITNKLVATAYVMFIGQLGSKDS